MLSQKIICGIVVVMVVLPVVTMVTLVDAATSSDSDSDESCIENRACPEDQYCDLHSLSCSPCSEICSRRETRLDCNKKCKDYLILQRIATLENNLYTAIISFAVILLILAVLVAVIVVRWCKKHGHLSCAVVKRMIGTGEKHNPPVMEYTHENPHTKSPKLSPRNSTNNNTPLPAPPATVGPPSIYSEGGDVSMKTVTTPVSRGYPVEYWRDNHAYDNGALAITPPENTYEYVEAKLNQKH